MGAVASTALQTTGGFLATLVFGACCSNYPTKRPAVSPELLRGLVGLTMSVLAPLLFAVTLAEGMSSALLGDMAVIMVWSACNIAVCALVGFGVMKLVGIPNNFRNEFVIGCCFQNSMAAPMVYMETLCRQSPLDETDFGPDGDVACVDRALTWIMIYSAAWIFLFFGFAYPILMPDDDEGDLKSLGKSLTLDGLLPKKEMSFGLAVWNRVKKVINGPIIGTCVGFAAGLIPSVQEALFDGPMIWLSSSAKTLGTPVVGLSALIVGATLGQTILRIANNNPKIGRICKKLYCNVQSKPLQTVNNAVGFGFTQTKATSAEGEEVDSMDDAVVVVFGSESEDTDIDEEYGAAAAAAATATVIARIPTIAEEDELPSAWTIGTFVFTRMAICPAISCAIVWAFSDRFINSADPNDEKLIKLMLMLEGAAPSADILIMTCQAAGRTTAAQALAVAYLAEYVLGVLTQTLATAFAVGWIYGDSFGVVEEAAILLMDNATNSSI